MLKGSTSYKLYLRANGYTFFQLFQNSQLANYIAREEDKVGIGEIKVEVKVCLGGKISTQL